MTSFKRQSNRSTSEFCQPSGTTHISTIAIASACNCFKVHYEQLQGVKCPVSNVCSDGQPTSQVRNNSPARPIIPEGRLKGKPKKLFPLSLLSAVT